MPTLTRWFVKSGLLCLLAGFLLAVLMQWPATQEWPWLRAAWPTYLHLLVVGWLTQLIFGVAFWLFPKYSAEHPRGSERLGWTSFVLLNVGLVLRIAGEPRALLGDDAATLLTASALAQLLAGWAFVANTWPRIRER
jgi:heme/copper-type cytochrome/quinol oxidase subunit 1